MFRLKVLGTTRRVRVPLLVLYTGERGGGGGEGDCDDSEQSVPLFGVSFTSRSEVPDFFRGYHP